MIPQCVTNVLRDFEPCVNVGEHLEDCRDEFCEGCRPAEPIRGTQVCRTCWTKIELAIADWGAFLYLLGDEARAVTPDMLVHGLSGPRIPLPPIPTDLDLPRRLFASNPGTLREWVSTVPGASDAVRFVRAVDHLTLKYPTDDSEIVLKGARCPKCGQRTVKRLPPLTPQHDVRYVCTRISCRHELTHHEARRVVAHLAGDWRCCRHCDSPNGCTDPSCERCNQRTPLEPWEPHAADHEPTLPDDRKALGLPKFDWTEFLEGA